MVVKEFGPAAAHFANRGCLAVWSAEPSKQFEQLLMSCSFHVRRFQVSAYKGSKAQTRFVWVASEDKNILPRSGGEPRLPLENTSRGKKTRLSTGKILQTSDKHPII
jgi:hypothetical protein